MAYPAEKTTRARTRSGLLAILWIVIAAAVAYRIATGVRARERSGGEGLVRWRAVSSAASVARSERKPILYDFTAAWCPPCRRLDVEGWADASIADLVNRSYLPARIVDRQREDGKNPAGIDELQRRYRITGFPTLVVAAADGTELRRAEGYRGRDFLVEFLEQSHPETITPIK